MCGTKSCAILGHSPMRFAWGFDEEAVECHDMKMELAQQINPTISFLVAQQQPAV